MTIEDFDKTEWTAGMSCAYNGILYEIASVELTERLLGISDNGGDDISWVRCENVANVG